ncbi:outer membrane beta-barrel protein [Photobacterium leiognathi]|uniref:outer membrane beta-barrel protein n=1 Tax=Photobacterium leiognathi TaxID=553611 RepID=UPI0029814415|nr:outer membrane beta-barrel protein [Photobacterium leiognathi]
MRAKKVLLLFSGCMTFSAWANPMHVKVTPFVFSKYLVNDNITQVSKDPISSPVVELTPGFILNGEKSTNTYDLTYYAKKATFLDSKQDDFIDHNLELDIEQHFTMRNKIKFKYQYIKSHDGRSDIRDDLLPYVTEPVKYDAQHGMLDYIYGAQWARGRLEFGAGFNTKRFKNYRHLPGAADLASTRFDDFNDILLEGQFTYRPSDVSEFFVRVENQDRTYLYNRFEGSTLDNNTNYFFLGTKLGINKDTHGSLMLGWQNKSFSQPDRPAFSGLSWRGDFFWSPVKHSTFSLETKREILDPDAKNDYRKETYYNFAWKHFWLNRLYSELKADYLTDEYTSGLRTDKTTGYEASIGYVFRNYLTFVTGWTKESNRSTVPINDYDQNIVYFSANFKLDSL